MELTTKKRREIIRKFIKTHNPDACFELWKNFDSEDENGEFHAFDAFGYTGWIGKGIFIIDETYEGLERIYLKTYPQYKERWDCGCPEIYEFKGYLVLFD